MEDFYDTRIDGVDGETVGLFGVFDGHGGARAAEFVKQNLFTNLIKHPKLFSDTKSAIAETYTSTDSELLKAETSHNRDAGSTASTAILVGDRLLVANVGDSRAVICRGGDGKIKNISIHVYFTDCWADSVSASPVHVFQPMSCPGLYHECSLCQPSNSILPITICF
jgi:serine/threonine protein phosphatase PrpC